jgi:Ti-type conjugative transfer relaxase TraA
VIARSVVGRGVTGLSSYVLGEGRGAGNDNLAPGEETRVAWLGGQNFGFDIDSLERARLATRIMEFDALNQASRTKRCEKDAMHLPLAWRVGEEPSREEMERAAQSALKAIGMGNAKAIWAAHRDEQHAHLHIVASKIDPDTGRAYNLKSDYLKLSKWAQQYEREHGGIVCLRREGANELRDAIANRDPQAVLEALTRQRATFTAADLERALGKQISSEISRAQFGNLVLGHPEVVRLADAPGGPTTRYSTRTVLASEQQVLQAADRMRRDSRHAVGDRISGLVLGGERFGTMREDQRQAFERATGAEGLSLIDGQAGTGKSYTMTAIRDAYEASGRNVIGLAPTNAVAQDMLRDGFRHAGTVHSELFALKNGRRQWDGRTVVMVDEAAMIDTKLMAELTQHARATGAKLILVGDDRQLASIDRGGMFGALKDRYGAAALTEVTRQHKDEERRAATMMAEGNFSDALAIYQDKGAIHWTRTQDQARAALVEDWAKDSTAAPGKSRFVFAYTNADVAQLNADLRAVRRLRGELGADRELPTADGKRVFAAGDRLQFTGTDKKLGLYNGAAGTVTAIAGTTVTVQLDGRRGEMRTFDAACFQSFRHGYAGTIYRGQGRTLDQTYLYHSEHWRSAASYVALTRHRDKAELFVATNTARDVTQLARQMARVDDRRAASQFYLQPGVSSDETRPRTRETEEGRGPAAQPPATQTSDGLSDGSARGRFEVLRDALREARELAEAARRHEREERDRDKEPDRGQEGR